MFIVKMLLSTTIALCVYVSSASAAVLDLVEVDYGTPGNSFINAPLPGQTGQIFITLRNSSNEFLSDIRLESHAGDCVEKMDSPQAISEIAPGQTMRMPTPLQIQLSRTCARGDVGTFLLFGIYNDAMRNDQRIWMDGKFLVAPFPEFNFLQAGLNTPLPDRQTVDFPIQVPVSFNVGTIVVQIDFDHSYPSDMDFTLVHPSGVAIQLTSAAQGRSLRFGPGGTNVAALRNLYGKNSQGTWILRSRDHTSGDSGILRKVGLQLKP